MDNVELLEQVKKGDKNAFDKLVKSNFGLIKCIANKFGNRGYEYEELFQVSCMGLVKAINNFNESQNAKLSTYAYHVIYGEVRRFLRDDNKNSLKIPRKIKELEMELYYKGLEFLDNFGREPSCKELAEYTGYEKETIKEVFMATKYCRSFQETVYKSEGENDITLADMIESNINLEEEIIKKLEIEHLYYYIDQLPERQRNVMLLRLKDKTQKQVTEILGLSQVEISRNEKRALKNLKKMYGIPEEKKVKISKKFKAFELFDKGLDIKDIAKELEVTIPAVYHYRTEYYKRMPICS